MQLIAVKTMNTSSDCDQRQEVDSYDDKSFFKQHKGPRTDPKEAAGANDFPPDESRGFNFDPFIVQHRNYHIGYLPTTPLDLFQLFVPKSLLWRWIEYTNSWICYLLENSVVDSWNNPLHERSQLLAWEGISTAQIYVWLGMLIYIGIHKERKLRSHWKAPRLGEQAPLHSVIKFMPYWRFQLIHRYLRPFDHTKIDDNAPLPKVFQAAEEWSDHIQKVSAALFQPGSHLAVDECMVRYTGRSTATTLVKEKPTPLGFKIWVIAQAGFFIQWLWHYKGSNYGAISRESRRKEGGYNPSEKREQAGNKEASFLPLSNTSGVVLSLCKSLPTQTYHVFVENLFSTPPLFRKLRDHGYGATGTARPNCGIHKDLKRDKALDKLGNCDYAFNEVRSIPSADNLVRSYDIFLCISLTNLSFSLLPRSIN
jgi:hypothetical protein